MAQAVQPSRWGLQTLADDARNNGKIVLADLCLRSGQAMLHDSPDVIPSISELVEGFRSGTPDASAVRATTFEIAARGYDLLLGLRRRRDWGALRPRAVTATLQGLLGAYRFVVADVEDDLEGELQGGSVEVEERNVLARTALGAADVVVVVARSDMAGLHSLLQTLAELDDFGVPADRVLPVCNGAPHTPSGRARLARAFAELARGTFSHQLATPIFIPHFRRVETAVADVSRLPAGLGSALCRAAIALAENSRDEASKEPEPLSPGSLGLLSEQVPSQ